MLLVVMWVSSVVLLFVVEIVGVMKLRWFS